MHSNQVGDPIHIAIAEHRTAREQYLDVLMSYARLVQPDPETERRMNAASAAYDQATEALFGVRPTSVAGVMALLTYIQGPMYDVARQPYDVNCRRSARH